MADAMKQTEDKSKQLQNQLKVAKETERKLKLEIEQAKESV
jgi:hypothetical protein